ncbi:IS630 family transposase [Candidatus Bealeia paramacronuclearis]|uniref:IS630 family transposase n=1 Tax=Candidatus Bealeia paramacronuclearis TaxID=1921001 RepID=UPI002F265597
MKQLEKIDPETIVWIDEAGIDNRLYREHAWAPRGQKVYAEIPGQKRERVSIIGGLMKGAFVAPFTFQGGCHADLFNAWLEEVLLPNLSKNTTLIMDNAAFHKSPKTKDLIEKFGCHLLFLPTDSPDLNPIEHWWHKIKSILRPLVQQNPENLHQLLDKLLSQYLSI